MKKKTLYTISAILFIVGMALIFLVATGTLQRCSSDGNPRDKAAAVIDAFEKSHDPLGIDYARNRASADTIIGYYNEFANNYPDDSLAPACLHKAANISCLIGDFDNAVVYAKKVVDGYVGYEAMDDCILTLAKSYELGERTDDAKAAYQLFIDTYPDHPLTEDLKRTIQLLDMGAVTPEEQLAAILADK